MAEKRTRSWPLSVSTSMESPSLTRVTWPSTTGNGRGASAAAAQPPSSSRIQRRNFLFPSLRGRGSGRGIRFDLLCLMRTMYHIRAYLFSILAAHLGAERHHAAILALAAAHDVLPGHRVFVDWRQTQIGYHAAADRGV